MAGKGGKGSAAAGSARGGGDGSDAKGGSTPAGSSGSAAGGGGGGAAGAASTAAASTATPSIARSAASTGGGGGGGSTRCFGFCAAFFAAGRGLRGGGATRAFGGAGFRVAGFAGFSGFAAFAGAGLRFGGACAGGAAGAGGGRTRGRGTARCAATCRFGLAFKRCVAAAREARIFAAFASRRSAAAARAWAAAAKGSVVATEDMSLCVTAVDGQRCGGPYRRRAARRQSVCVRNGRAALLCCKGLNSRGSEDPFLLFYKFSPARQPDVGQVGLRGGGTVRGPRDVIGLSLTPEAPDNYDVRWRAG